MRVAWGGRPANSCRPLCCNGLHASRYVRWRDIILRPRFPCPRTSSLPGLLTTVRLGLLFLLQLAVRSCMEHEKVFSAGEAADCIFIVVCGVVGDGINETYTAGMYFGDEHNVRCRLPPPLLSSPSPSSTADN